MSESVSTPYPDSGRRLMRLAARLGSWFIVLHAVTVIVTCVVEGFDWGINAWILDVSGFLASVFFTGLCWLSAGKPADQFQSGDRWILVWAVITLIARSIDTLMLLGIFRWDEVYVTPVGIVFWSNVVSEIIVGTAFNFTAFIAALLRFRR